MLSIGDMKAENKKDSKRYIKQTVIKKADASILISHKSDFETQKLYETKHFIMKKRSGICNSYKLISSTKGAIREHTLKNEREKHAIQ